MKIGIRFRLRKKFYRLMNLPNLNHRVLNIRGENIITLQITHCSTESIALTLPPPAISVNDNAFDFKTFFYNPSDIFYKSFLNLWFFNRLLHTTTCNSMPKFCPYKPTPGPIQEVITYMTIKCIDTDV